MTVGELLDALDGLPVDVLVVIAKDSEGNGFSPLAEVDNDSRYTAETEWHGYVHHADDWPDHPEAERVVCLWPTN